MFYCHEKYVGIKMQNTVIVRVINNFMENIIYILFYFWAEMFLCFTHIGDFVVQMEKLF